MIELKRDKLVFSFPEIHKQAKFTVSFQRTLRIPDDGSDYPLPPGLGNFPLRHVDDFSKDVPESWIQRGGVMLPMYQAEALWLNFDSDFLPEHGSGYPFAIKVSTGKIDAVTGNDWSETLAGEAQDYMVSTEQPWLDGYCIEKGTIRQFVAMPLGAGYSTEEQLTGNAEFGGIQIKVFPMRRDEFFKRFPKSVVRMRKLVLNDYSAASIDFCEMGLAPGGRMKQEIYTDPFGVDVWDQSTTSRCFVHIANSVVWESITGKKPPHAPLTAKRYSKLGLPWFDYYSESPAVSGSHKLANVKSVAQTAAQTGQMPLPENNSTPTPNVHVVGTKLAPGQVREGRF